MTESPTGSAVHADCVAAVRAAASLCESLGHQVEEAALAVDGDAFTTHFVNQWACSNASAIEDWQARVGRVAAEGDLEPLSWALVELGRSIDGGQYLDGARSCSASAAGSPGTSRGATLLTPTLGEPPAPGHLRLAPGRAPDRPPSGPPPTCPSPRRST